MAITEQIAEYAGAAIVNKFVNRKKKDNIFTRLWGMIRFLLDDPEKMELRITVESGNVVARVKPDKEEKQGFVMTVGTFDEF